MTEEVMTAVPVSLRILVVERAIPQGVPPWHQSRRRQRIQGLSPQ
jgi:hypothetical protein